VEIWTFTGFGDEAGKNGALELAVMDGSTHVVVSGLKTTLPRSRLIRIRYEYLISARTHVNVAQLGFDSRRDTIQYIAVLPNGTHYELTSLDLSVGQWVELFNIGLDDSNREAALTTSVGVPKNRLAGVLLNVEVEVTNVRSRWDFPGDIVVLWHLSAVPSWQRVNLADERVSVQTDDGMTTIIRSTHAYGLKWVFSKRSPSGVHVLDAGSCLISVFDIVVLFSIMKWLASKFALACFGKDSARWKGVVTADVGALAKGLLVSKERGGSGTVGDVVDRESSVRVTNVGA
jgi:hypothetical protein